MQDNHDKEQKGKLPGYTHRLDWRESSGRVVRNTGLPPASHCLIPPVLTLEWSIIDVRWNLRGLLQKKSFNRKFSGKTKTWAGKNILSREWKGSSRKSKTKYRYIFLDKIYCMYNTKKVFLSKLLSIYTVWNAKKPQKTPFCNIERRRN